jgi:molybdopterin-guanine dinucleotide biosynthesis protein A
VWCIVVAGGSGRRFGGAKQFAAFIDSAGFAQQHRATHGCRHEVVAGWHLGQPGDRLVGLAGVFRDLGHQESGG